MFWISCNVLSMPGTTCYIILISTWKDYTNSSKLFMYELNTKTEVSLPFSETSMVHVHLCFAFWSWTMLISQLCGVVAVTCRWCNPKLVWDQSTTKAPKSVQRWDPQRCILAPTKVCNVLRIHAFILDIFGEVMMFKTTYSNETRTIQRIMANMRLERYVKASVLGKLCYK